MEVLATLLKSQTNCRVIDEYIRTCTSTEIEYNDLLYEVIGDLCIGKSCSQILTSLNNRQFGWNNTHFDEVEEGVLECSKCHSKRTISYQRQTRSADEGATTFAQCVNCSHKWKHNN
jgi:DNA-directed RNA polymerase subunit M/transcription elongation factor TFIIS